jgi:ferrous iron transport protein B
MTITIALAGNPNVGKSTIFNALTGSRQHVGNWPGKTVEKKEGRLRIGEDDILVIDLPGTYSLTAYSIEEIIARDYIVNDHPTAVVAVVDAANLERNLYLVAQLIELDVPVIVALNMTDVASSRGLTIDAGRLSERLGRLPVIETVGNRQLGIDGLKKAIAQVAAHPPTARLQPTYSGILAKELEGLEARIASDEGVSKAYYKHWLATKLLEDDEVVVEDLEGRGAGVLVEAARAAQRRIEEATGEDAETLIADQRFTANVSAPFLDWVDVFFNQTVYSWGTELMGLLGLGGSWLAALLTDGIIAGVGGVLVFVPVLLFLYLALAVLEDSGYMARAAFVMDRVMRWMGLHGKSFLPMIVGFGCTVPAVYATRTLENEKDRKLTAFLATFMSCGARLPVYVVFGAAFFGAASGNLIFAMYVLGIGVALATGFVLKNTVYKGKPPAPFVMELPPYRLPRPKDMWRQTWERTREFLIKAGTVILSVSIVLWLLMAIPIHPDAGSFNDVAAEDSVFGTLSGAVAPIFKPAGFGGWQASGSLVTGILAKEVVVSTMSQIYVSEADRSGAALEEGTVEPTTFGQDVGASVIGFGEAAILTVQEVINIAPRTINLVPGVNVGELSFFPSAAEEENTTRLESALVGSFAASAGSASAGPLAAVAFNVFVLLYVPCMAATAAMRHEFGWRWMWAQVAYTLALAWVAAVLVFQVGKLLFL